jgi:hypothetical protein
MKSKKKDDPLKFLWKIPPWEDGQMQSVSGLTDEPAPAGYAWRIFDPKHAVQRLDELEAEIRILDERTRDAGRFEIERFQRKQVHGWVVVYSDGSAELRPSRGVHR